MRANSQTQKPNWLEVLSTIKPHEFKATLTAFLMVLILMASYFVLRPVRDALASDWSDAEELSLESTVFYQCRRRFNLRRIGLIRTI